MAAIGKIREQSTLLLIVIGGAMVAFVLGDIFSNRGSSPADQYVGEVYGEEINLLDYERRVEAQKESMASIGQPVSSAAEQQIRNQVWNSMVQERIMYNEMNKLGLRLGQDEFDDVRFGESVLPEFASDENFKNPETGEFDPKLVQNYFAFLKERYPLFYESQVNRIVNERLYKKYNNLIKGGITVNTLEAKDEYYRQDYKVSFNFLARKYSDIVDSTVAVSDADLKAYFNEHKDEERFEREAMVDLKFVVFDVEPTPEDLADIREDLTELVGDFRASKNDSLFVLKYSNIKNGSPVPLDPKSSEELPSLLEGAELGEVVGPFKMGQRFAIAKLASASPKEEATARHILLSKTTQPDVEILMARADSLKKVIQRNDNFEELVPLFSEDPGSVEKGGVYEWFDRETMVPEFTEASFERPIGSINIVETDYGIHIVEPLERREGKSYTAYIVDEQIEPSNNTFNEVYDIANDFSITADNLEGMETLANERGYEIKEGNDITSQARNIPGVARSVEAVRWAHNKERSDLGDLSQPFEFDTKIVVLGLVNRTDAGRATFEMAKEEIKPEVILEKKKEMLTNEMAGKSFDQLKTEFGLDVQAASNVSEKRPSLPGGASEPYIVGYAISMEEGAVSKPLEGNSGVYVVELKSKSEIAPREEYETYRDELSENRENAMKNYTTGVYRALKDFAKVKDERSSAY